MTTRMSADIMDEVGTLVVGEGQLDRARYVASNRFRVQEGKGAAFEKRWAERPSRLAKLDGFRYFTLMRRVEAPEETGVAYAADEPTTCHSPSGTIRMGSMRGVRVTRLRKRTEVEPSLGS